MTPPQSVPEPTPRDVTVLLHELQAGRKEAFTELLARVYAELRALAHRQLRGERSGHTLQTTDLVNEAWLRLARDEKDVWTSRGHFFTAAATAMRRILVEAARRRNAKKRGGGAAARDVHELEELDELLPVGRMSDELSADVEALNVALERLENHASLREKSKVVELRYFVGLTIEQTAQVLHVSAATVKRDWEFCRAWLLRELSRAG